MDNITISYLRQDIEELIPLLHENIGKQRNIEANQDVILHKIKIINETIKYQNKTIIILLITTIINAITIIMLSLK